ncbi:MAG TPA: hypothetical protein VGN17_28355 [Bryobacteraceae bacterium]
MQKQAKLLPTEKLYNGVVGIDELWRLKEMEREIDLWYLDECGAERSPRTQDAGQKGS